MLYVLYMFLKLSPNCTLLLPDMETALGSDEAIPRKELPYDLASTVVVAYHIVATQGLELAIAAHVDIARDHGSLLSNQ